MQHLAKRFAPGWSGAPPTEGEEWPILRDYEAKAGRQELVGTSTRAKPRSQQSRRRPKATWEQMSHMHDQLQ